MDYKGIIIQEILTDREVLKTRREKVVPKHKTPWLKQWMLHAVKIPVNEVDSIANKSSKSIEIELLGATIKNPETKRWGLNKNITYFKVTPKWIRYSDLNQNPWNVFEITL